MGTIDWGSERAEVYISQMRELEAAGDPMHTIRRRPAVDHAERVMAKEIRRRVDRLTIGWRQVTGEAHPATRPGRKVCELCGRRRVQLRIARQIWRGGQRLDIWRCKGGCKGV